MPCTLSPLDPLTHPPPNCGWWLEWTTPTLFSFRQHNTAGKLYAHGLLTLTTDAPHGAHLAHLHLTYPSRIGDLHAHLLSASICLELSPPHPALAPIPDLSRGLLRQIPSWIQWDAQYLYGDDATALPFTVQIPPTLRIPVTVRPLCHR